MKAHEGKETSSISVRPSIAGSSGEILLSSICLAVASTIWIGLANGYFSHGFWYLSTILLRNLFTIFFSGIVLYHLIFRLAERTILSNVARLASKFVLLAACSYLAYLALWYSGSIYAFTDSARKAAWMHDALSFVFGCIGLLILTRVSSKRKLLEGFFRTALVPALVLIVVIFVIPSFLRDNSTDRNVVFITIDTLRADHLGCYGYRRDTSPNLDEFAKRSYRFENASVQWPKTSPSFASMLTSLYCSQTGVTGTRQKLPHGKTTIAEVFKDAGYETAGIIGNGNLAGAYNFDQGFSTYIEAWKDNHVPIERRCDARHITDLSLPILEQVSKKSKFFMWIHYIDPHAPYSPPQPFDSLFVGDEYYGERRIQLNEGFNDDIGGCPRRSRLGENDNLDFYIAQYDAEIRYFDFELKRVFDFLETNGLMNNTMVVISSDHGESLGEHNYFFEHGKFSYDACLRVPLIVWIPGGKPAVLGRAVALLDVYPSMLDFAGLLDRYNTVHEGISFLESLAGFEPDGSRRVFSQSGGAKNPVWAIRDGRWKLIYAPSSKFRNIMTGSLYELYDLQTDPDETNNLFSPEDSTFVSLELDLHRWIDTKNNYGETVERVFDSSEESTNENLRVLGYIE